MTDKGCREVRQKRKTHVGGSTEPFTFPLSDTGGKARGVYQGASNADRAPLRGSVCWGAAGGTALLALCPDPLLPPVSPFSSHTRGDPCQQVGPRGGACGDTTTPPEAFLLSESAA